MTKIIYTGSPGAFNLRVAEYREGKATLEPGDEFEVPAEVAKSLRDSSPFFSEAPAKKLGGNV